MPNARTDTASQAGSATRRDGERSVHARYDGWAPSYDVHTAKVGWCAPSRLLDAVAEVQAPAAHLRVVDLGVGTGQASEPYLDVGARVTGLDLAPAMLEAAAAVRPGFFRLVEHDLAHPFEAAGLVPGSHDLVLGCGVVHFVEDLAGLLRRCAGLLDAGGLLAFTYIPTQDRAFSAATHPQRPEAVHGWLVDAGLSPLRDEAFVAYVKEDGPVHYRLCLARDPRSAPRLVGPLARIDRTACVDRARVVALADTPPWSRPPGASAATGAQLLDALERQVHTDALDLDQLPWPAGAGAKPTSLGAASRCDVLAVFAHPDDESLYAGETLAALAGSGHRVHLLVLTDGAGGRSTVSVDGSSLAEVRRAELTAAALRLGAAEVEVLDFADFGKHRDPARTQPVTASDALRHWGARAVVDAVANRLRRDRPRAVLGFAPDRDPNYSLHGHHLGAGVATTVAVALVDAEGTAPPTRQWAAVALEEVGAPGRSIGGASTRLRKIDAVRCHVSQSFSSTRTLEQLARGTAPREGWHPIASAPDAVHEGDPAHVFAAQRLAGEPAWSSAVAVDLAPFDASRPVGADQDRPAEVVTGQQVGLFGGPALTLHKAVGALAEARRRGGRARFWMATHDHDLGEVSGLWLPHAGGQRRLRWSAAHDGRAVGGRAFDDSITTVVDRAIAALAEAPSRARAVDEAAAWLGRHYVPGMTLARAFAGALGELLPGLEILDPRDEAWAEAAAPLYARVLASPRDVLAAMRAREAALRSAQEPVPVRRDSDCLPLFVDDEAGRRTALRWTDDGFVLGERPVGLDDLRRWLDTSPQRFSPDVLMRPAVQDALLQTTHYIGGPNELAYWVQATALHDLLGVRPARRVLRPQLCVLDAWEATLWQSQTGMPPAALAFDDAGLDRALAGFRRNDDRAAALEATRAAICSIHDALRALTNPDADALRRFARELAPLEVELREAPDALARTARQLPFASAQLELAAVDFAAARPGSSPSRRPIGRAIRTLLRLERAIERAQRAPLRRVAQIQRRARPRGGPQDRSMSVLELVARHGLDVGRRLLPEVERQLWARGDRPRAWVVALETGGAD